MSPFSVFASLFLFIDFLIIALYVRRKHIGIVYCDIQVKKMWRIFKDQEAVLNVKELREYSSYGYFLRNLWENKFYITTTQFSSVAQSCPTLWNPMSHSTPGLPVHHQLPESTQTHVHCVSDAIQPSHPLSSPSPPALNLSHHQSLFRWVSTSHEVAKVLEFQLQHQSFQWTPRTDLL